MKSVFKVDGMSCSHCENAVKDALGAIGGVVSVDVNLAEKTVTVEHDEGVTRAQIEAIIEEEGYENIR